MIGQYDRAVDDLSEAVRLAPKRRWCISTGPTSMPGWGSKNKPSLITKQRAGSIPI